MANGLSGLFYPHSILRSVHAVTNGKKSPSFTFFRCSQQLPLIGIKISINFQ